MTDTLLVLGTGSLAGQVCGSIAVLAPEPLRLVLVGRDPDRAARLGYLTATRARLAGRPVTVQVEVADATDRAALDRLVTRYRPVGVASITSPQSPWEPQRARSAWTDLLADAGFAVTLPFQAVIAARVAEVLAERGGWLVNASLPDAVNPLLAARGPAPLCGVGNVGILAASLAATLPAGAPLRVVGHHWHLHRPDDPTAEARAFVGTEEIPDVSARLAGQRGTPRETLNQVTGLASARVLLGLLGTGPAADSVPDRPGLPGGAAASVPGPLGSPGRDAAGVPGPTGLPGGDAASVPGPLGLPGGYPVRLGRGSVALDLPPALDRATAVALNEDWSRRDGVWVDGSRVVYGQRIAAALAEHAQDLGAGFPAAALDDAYTALSTLRSTLRARPPRDG
ncbi:potassium transporter TrkA [Actinocatenispora sera]|uniref:potassium transporter TrkA n=1 Tax=Actinocatenispora sera TaxID=390989 RepID=UPI0033C28BCC